MKDSLQNHRRPLKLQKDPLKYKQGYLHKWKRAEENKTRSPVLEPFEKVPLPLRRDPPQSRPTCFMSDYESSFDFLEKFLILPEIAKNFATP